MSQDLPAVGAGEVYFLFFSLTWFFYHNREPFSTPYKPQVMQPQTPVRSILLELGIAEIGAVFFVAVLDVVDQPVAQKVV